MTNFEEVCTVPTEFGVTFTKLKSEKTGLTVMLADIEAPLVNGYFALATESFDDYGCPHTLEHLVFLGSEQYPYKGVLDSLANRAIAQGTNAWTDVDHTCYTITTAGSKGFLNLLPIYIDHILYPTLTDSGYHTEVHHITGEGEDAGVVYSEMQGCQNLGDDRLHLRMKRLMFPENCGYRSETGGLMERLRELSVDRIRNYHKSYYRPDNLCLIITGKVDKDELLQTLEPVEESILKKGPLAEMQRPWIETGDFPNLQKNIEETVLFADEDESMGTILIAWNGPKYDEFLTQKELEVLNVYLTDSPVSVLQKTFVETEDALCTDVDFHITDHLKTTLMFTASSVPLEEIENFPNKFFETLQRIVDEEDIDMTRMATVIEKEILNLFDSAETDAHESAASVAIADFLYGNTDGSQLGDAVRDLEFLKKVATYKASDWINILKKWYVDAYRIILFGKPSAEFAEQQAMEEEERVEKRRIELGEEKLEEFEKQLEEAKAKNEVPIPKEIFDNFKIPSASTIHFINVTTARNNDKSIANKVQDHVNADTHADVPFFIQYDHVKSRFVKLSVYLSSSSIPSHLLPYTRLFLKAIFSLPIQINGELISYEDVVKGLSEDTIEYDASLGTSFGFKELVVFTIKAESKKYEKAIEWLHNIIWNTQFAAERIKIVATQILNDIPQAKREGHNMANACLSALQIDPKKSVNGVRNILFQNAFLQDMLKRLEKDSQSVINDLNEYRSKLCMPKNIRIHVTGDILDLPSPRKAFEGFANNVKDNMKPLMPVVTAKEVLKPAGLEPGRNGLLVTLPTIENSFSLHTVKGPSKFDDPDIPPLLVMIELLDTMEGIFWKLIRGRGLAYSCFLDANIESGLINFTIYRSPDAFKAFEQAKNVIEQLANHQMEIDPSSVDGAKSAVIYSLVAKENTMDRAALQSFVNQVLKKMPATYNRDMLIAIQVKMKSFYFCNKT
ncbi:Metalloenzyme, LuxS/M16 peptidase-like protein [Mycotypha africana]|uniref:Metalloenzyme, LuxS/M16 peptidase-like protein n=1 Tax=Mycotypha africana TaxID=64632 RepID=UPI002301A6CC|nr:Metalloenzyme, LuxS/M16 peptidase-like protein [Mycotypha africana]KAI8973781.1 Metalloenzyme, LuxS/M16 peptidase-like protein [Mycotypha africana]